MSNIEATWATLVHKLEGLRHKIDAGFHKDLDEIGLHAAHLKSIAGHEATKSGAPFVAAQVQPVTNDAIQAAQTTEAGPVQPEKDILK